ncbi:MAG: DUF2029 domain-containing protein [Candidatus Obscuribacter sp.]|nr:DUF2029 domain-containing protein [Candidatus Obscuribacter sp.]
MQSSRREADYIAVKLWELFFYCTSFSVLGLALVQVIFCLTHPMLAQSDQSMYLSMADLLLRGRVPYVDCFDNNPPLIIYLNVIPVIVASWFKVPISLAFSLCITALSVIGSILSLLLCRPLKGRLDGLLVMAAILGYAFFNHGQELDLGQREHLFAISMLPFLLTRYLRYRDLVPPRWLSIAAGVLAGVGIALKHYFLLIALGCEFAWLARKGSLRILFTVENYACFATIALYLLHFAFLPKAMVSGYFDFVVPIYQVGYSYYTNSFVFNVATFWRTDFIYLALVTFVGFVLAPLACDAGLLLMGLIVFGWLSTSVFVFAGQSWQYHLVPIRMATTAALFVEIAIALILLARIPRPRLKRALMPLLALVPLAPLIDEGEALYLRLEEEERVQEHFDLGFLGYKGTCFEYELSPAVKTILANTTKDDTVLFISSGMAPGYPSMIQSERRPASRLIHGMLFTVLDYDLSLKKLPERPRFEAYHKQVLDWYVEDIAKNKPVLIFIQLAPMGDILNRLHFVDKYMNDYELIGTDYGMQIYRRKGGSR